MCVSRAENLHIIVPSDGLYQGDNELIFALSAALVAATVVVGIYDVANAPASSCAPHTITDAPTAGVPPVNPA